MEMSPRYSQVCMHALGNLVSNAGYMAQMACKKWPSCQLYDSDSKLA